MCVHSEGVASSIDDAALTILRLSKGNAAAFAVNIESSQRYELNYLARVYETLGNHSEGGDAGYEEIFSPTQFHEVG